MNDQKQEVFQFLKNLPADASEGYNKAFSLYRMHPNKHQGHERTFNQGYSERNYSSLLYELQKVYQIEDVELLEEPEVVEETTAAYTQEQLEQFRDELVQKVLKTYEIATSSDDRTEEDTKKDEVNFKNEIQSLNLFLEKYPELKSEATDAVLAFSLENTENNEEETDVTSTEASTEVPATTEASVEKKTEEASLSTAASTSTEDTGKEFIPAPTSEERAKLRDDFPFLKEEDCPMELKALVTDKINAYQDYVTSHNTLVKHANGEVQLTEDELQALTQKSVESFELNREIYDELNYYKSNGKILGNHPIFKSYNLQKEVDVMDTKELYAFVSNTPPYLSKAKADLEKNKDNTEKVAAITAKIDTRKQKLALVNKKLGLSE